MMKTFRHKLRVLAALAAVLAVALVWAPVDAGAQAAGSQTVKRGSFFAPLFDGTGYTALIGNSFTNLPSTNVTVVSVAGAEDGMAIVVDLVGAVGTTNGILQLGFGLSTDDSNFTTETNFFLVRAPVAGTTRVRWMTNVPASALLGASSMRLQQVASTNTSAYHITNVTYRVVQRRY